MSEQSAPTAPEEPQLHQEAARRRTFAVISHPDAGKSTLTEALVLHAKVIGTAGATHGKSNRRGTVSDWMKMERDRGISISSAALQFEYRNTIINLLDTPGHADFSEDTYRVLAAVDCAVMLLDAAKGFEAQTRKLLSVCRARNLPIITVINKWDRPGLDALELIDEIASETGLEPTALTWPVGRSGDFRGVIDRSSGEYVRYRSAAAVGSIAREERFSFEQAAEAEGELWKESLEEFELVAASDTGFNAEDFLAGRSTPVLFTAAASNFGVRQLLDTLVDMAPPAGARPTAGGEKQPVDAPFSGFVFKVQAGMDTAHRDHIAFLRVCSGVFERGMVVTHASTGKSFATKYAHHVFGREREVIDQAWPGDVVGLVNASALGVGDTLYVGEPVHYPPIPHFSPEHFSAARAVDPGRYKQFRRGIRQLEHEGVVQVLRSDLRGDQAPVLAAVGPMQFEVTEQRMSEEFNAPVRLEPLAYTMARVIGRTDIRSIEAVLGSEVLQRGNGEALVLFTDRWKMRRFEQTNPDVPLGLIGGEGAVEA